MQLYEFDRQLKEQFIYGLNDDDILTEILQKCTAMKDTSIVTSEQASNSTGQVRWSLMITNCGIRQFKRIKWL